MTITSVLIKIAGILNIVIPILITLGVIFFIWGVIKYVTAKDEEQQKEGRTTIVSGIVGLFVIVAIWGLVGILQNTLFGGATNNQLNNNQIPCVPIPGVVC